MSYTARKPNDSMTTENIQPPPTLAEAPDGRVSSGPSLGSFLDALADARGYVRNGKRAWVVTWPDGHITCETSPALLKCRDTKVVEVNEAGQLILA